MAQARLADAVGVSRGRLADLEAGKDSAGTPPEVWFALAQAIRRFLKFELGRDPMQELADAGHLDIQEMLLKLTASAWSGGFELATKPSDPGRSIDVPLVDHGRRRLVIAECWNTFGNLNQAVRSSDRKVPEATQLMLARTGQAYEIGLVWIVRDTKANRALVTRYEHIFKRRFPGSSAAWVTALIQPGAPVPAEPGLVWCDIRATRLFARRSGRR